jgi:hypothetical protein
MRIKTPYLTCLTGSRTNQTKKPFNFDVIFLKKMHTLLKAPILCFSKKN